MVGRLSPNPHLAQALTRDPDGVPLDTRSRALADLAVTLTRTPAADPQSGLTRLRALGISDRGFHHAVNVIAYFNYVNRIAAGLGVELEG